MTIIFFKIPSNVLSVQLSHATNQVQIRGTTKHLKIPHVNMGHNPSKHLDSILRHHLNSTSQNTTSTNSNFYLTNHDTIKITTPQPINQSSNYNSKSFKNWLSLQNLNVIHENIISQKEVY